MPASTAPSPLSGTPAVATLLVEQLITLGLREAVVAPGSRSAPLAAALGRAAEEGRVRTFVVYDERSAGYVALGLAQQLRRPVALLCTSGTAAVNFGPAVAEAFYQQLPLLLLTADRPPEWIDQEDNQAVRQNGLYGAHVRAAFTLSLSDNFADLEWFVRRTANDLWQVANAEPRGPVHLNLPSREPLYPAEAPMSRARPTAHAVATESHVAPAAWDELLELWRGAQRVLFVAGLHPPDEELEAALGSLLAAAPAAVLLADSTANLPALSIRHWENVLGTRDEHLLDALAPELVVTLGGQVTSKALRSFLRARPPRALWRIAPDLPAPDTWQSLSHVLPVAPAPFLRELARRGRPGPPEEEPAFARLWQQAGAAAGALVSAALATLPFCESVAVQAILAALPADSVLQVGNSLPIRHVNQLGLGVRKRFPHLFANRGTSGIDGVVSTAVGAAHAHSANGRPVTLLTGDLSFFYDRNGLWQPNLPPNLRIVVLNNHGGAIFDVIAGPDQLPEVLRRDYFLTPHQMTARRTAEDAGLRYLHARDAEALTPALHALYSPEGGATLLEVELPLSGVGATFHTPANATHALRLADLSPAHKE